MFINGEESRFANLQKLTNFATEFAKVGQIASKPAFELQFSIAQNALIDRLNEEIEILQKGVDTSAATALLRVQQSDLENKLVGLSEYKELTDKRVHRIEDTLTYLGDLKGLADASTVAEFDTLLAQTIDLLEKTDTPINITYGVNDKLRAHKTDALADLYALTHNNFATQTDIDNVTATLTAIETDYLLSQSINAVNADLAYSLHSAATEKKFSLSADIAEIEADATAEVADSVQKKQAQAAELLTALSLSFEVAQEFTKFMSDSLTQPPKSQKGTVVDLVS